MQPASFVTHSIYVAVVLSPVVVATVVVMVDDATAAGVLCLVVSIGAGNLACSQANWDGINGGGPVGSFHSRC